MLRGSLPAVILAPKTSLRPATNDRSRLVLDLSPFSNVGVMFFLFFDIVTLFKKTTFAMFNDHYILLHVNVLQDDAM